MSLLTHLVSLQNRTADCGIILLSRIKLLVAAEALVQLLAAEKCKCEQHSQDERNAPGSRDCSQLGIQDLPDASEPCCCELSAACSKTVSMQSN